GAAVDVLALAEGIDEALVARVVREDAELDLRIVGRNELGALRGNERLADPDAFGAADRNVLDIRVRAGETPRRGTRLDEGRMDAARRGVDERRKCVDVGALQLREMTMREDPGR